MIVQFTTRQLDQVVRFVDAVEAPWQPEAKSWLDTGVSMRYGTKDRWSARMPAIGWKLVAEALFDYCFDERGHRNRKVATAAVRAHVQIQRAVNIRWIHPAMMGHGAAGSHNEVIPAWRYLISRGDWRIFSPYPEVDAEFVVLHPISYDEAGIVATRWTPGRRLDSDPMILMPEVHWAFVGG